MSDHGLDSTTIIDNLSRHLERFFKNNKDSIAESGLYNRIIHEVERVLIQKTINHTDNVQIKAAKILGINRNTLRKKIKDLKIDHIEKS